MKFGRLSVILTEDQEKNLNKLDWFLNITDNEIKKVESFFERLELLNPQKIGIHSKYKELILFKINQIFHLVLSLEQNIYDSSFDYYRQHFGIHKNKNKFLEMKEMTISYQFESFLAQLKSLIDFFLKYIGDTKLHGKIPKMESFEYITRKYKVLSLRKYRTSKYKNAKRYINILKKEKSLKYFFKNYDAFYNLKNYRDFIIHQGRIKQDKSVSQADRYVQYNYRIPEIRLTNNEYKIDETRLFRLDFYCRLRYIELIYTIWKSLNELIDPEQLKLAKKNLKGTNAKDLKEVLEYLGRKLIWNDRSFMNKLDVEDFLKKVGLSFSDLIVDKVIKERQMKDIKSVKDEDMSYLLERTIYKSIRGIRFQKIRYNYDRDWKPEREKDIYGFTRASFMVDDMNLSKECVDKSLKSFIELGIVIKVDEKECVIYEFIDEELQHYVATLTNLSWYKWSFIQHPQIKYFRKPKKSEREYLKSIYKEKLNEQLKSEIDKKKKQNEEYKTYKIRQKAWKKFKDENNLNIKNFKKNSLNYGKISRVWNSGLYKEIKDKWNAEYTEEGHFDIMNKDGTQVIERVFLLEYLHELNTDFKSWKQRFREGKLIEIEEIAKRVFHRQKKHWLDLQKNWLRKSKKEYTNRLQNERERFAKIRRKYVYLNHALKLINSDFFKSTPDLE